MPSGATALADPLLDDDTARLSTRLEHDFPFDPAYGYDVAGLLAVEPPPEPPGFVEFWRARYARALAVDPEPRLTVSRHARDGFLVWDVAYRSTGGVPIRGWLLEPLSAPARAAFVVGHGYGGLAAPDVPLLYPDVAYLVPSLRGLGLSAQEPFSANPAWHVLHDIHDRERYVLGGCVEDLWTGVSALLALRPDVRGRVWYTGHSFSGGVGIMALAWDDRVSRAHVDVPSFGHHPLRLALPTTGSAASVQAFVAQHVHVADTLPFYDSAVAARHVRLPVHLAAALFDPVVVPPGQFAVHNALPGPTELFLRRAGHFAHPGQADEDRVLLSQLRGFFRSDDQPRVSPLAQPRPGP
jgi:cephalosporin-C deacetylase